MTIYQVMMYDEQRYSYGKPVEIIAKNLTEAQNQAADISAMKNCKLALATPWSLKMILFNNGIRISGRI